MLYVVSKFKSLMPAAIAALILGYGAVTSAQTYTVTDQCGDAVQVNGPIHPAPCGDPNCKSCGQHLRQGCTTCADGCELEIKEEKVKKTCYEIEKKTICIPTVQLPFGFCCKPLSARSKTIKVLKTKTYECPTTKYIWSKAKTEPAPSTTAVPMTLVDPSCTTPINAQSVEAVKASEATLIAPEPTIQPVPVVEPQK